ncbi:MAG: hypothetical protein JWN38_1122 [Candidatus Saccharibacteria bacterium]|nr:hypothetical protein [Candidatus Saccharibacteria bacterium]
MVVGFFVWHNHSQDSSSHQSSQRSATSYFIISKYFVRLPLTSELADLKESSPQPSAYNANDDSVSVLAPHLDAGWKCAADAAGHKAIIGNILISLQGTEAARTGFQPAASKKIGNYTYSFYPVTGTSCVGNADISTFTQLQKLFASQFGQLQSN